MFRIKTRRIRSLIMNLSKLASKFLSCRSRRKKQKKPLKSKNKPNKLSHRLKRNLR